MKEGMHCRSSMYFISRLHMKPGAVMDSFNPSSDHQPTSQLKYSMNLTIMVFNIVLTFNLLPIYGIPNEIPKLLPHITVL